MAEKLDTRRVITHDEVSGEMEVGYKHDPGPQWTVGRLIEELRRFPPEKPVQVVFGVEGPDQKITDDQPVIGVEVREFRFHVRGGGHEDRPEDAVSIVADYRAGEYVRYVQRGDTEYDELAGR